jgi:hypothetical protein
MGCYNHLFIKGHFSLDDAFELFIFKSLLYLCICAQVTVVSICSYLFYFVKQVVGTKTTA